MSTVPKRVDQPVVWNGKVPYLGLKSFRESDAEAARAAFIQLLTAAAAGDGRAVILLALRADFVSHCARYPDLREMLNREFQLVGSMDPPDLAKAITLPAAAAVAAVATVVALIFLVVARGERAEAEEARAEVERLNRETRSRRLAAEAENMLARDLEGALLLAVAAYQTTSRSEETTTDEARAALHHSLDTPYRTTLAGHEGWVQSAAFSPDGTRVVTASYDRTARVWAIPNPYMIAEAQLRLRREPANIIPNFCARYFQDAPDECPATLAQLFPAGD